MGMSSKIVQKNAAYLPRFQDECLRGGCAALSRQKKTPCKSFAEGLFRDVTKMMNAAKVPRAADLPRSVFLQDRLDLAFQLSSAVWWRRIGRAIGETEQLISSDAEVSSYSTNFANAWFGATILPCRICGLLYIEQSRKCALWHSATKPFEVLAKCFLHSNNSNTNISKIPA